MIKLLNRLFLMILSLFALAIDGDDVHQSDDYTELLEPKLRKIFYETYKEVPEQYSKVYKILKSKKARETDWGMGAMRPWNEFGSIEGTYGAGGTLNPAVPDMPEIPWQIVPPGLERVYVHREFADGFKIQRKFMDDEQYSILEKMSGDLARAGRYKVESDAATMFDNGFIVNGYDGVPLFSANHPLLIGGGGTGSNAIAGPLSDASLKEASTLMRKQVDEAGKLIQLQPNTLIVPPELEWIANELTGSDKRVDTNLNNKNSMKGRYNVVVWDFLTNPDAWYLADSTRHEINWFWRVRPEFAREKDFNTIVSKWRGYMRYSFGYSDYRGIIGSTGL